MLKPVTASLPRPPASRARSGFSSLRCYDNCMSFRTAALLLLSFVCAFTPADVLSQTSDSPSDAASSNLPKSFHDPALNITYFYPGRFTPDPASSSAPESSSSGASSQTKCAHSTLFANSITPVDTSSFVLSTIDNTCPAVLQGAVNLGPFVREQILRQLKQYGAPTVTQEPTLYAIDGHPAAIVLASVPMPPVPGSLLAGTTYAAKVCMLGSVPIPPKHRRDPAAPVRHVLCFDFTTLHKDVLSILFSFSMQFDNNTPQPIVPGSVIR